MKVIMDSDCDIVDVSPRDGLQMECAVLPADVRLELIGRLEKAGLGTIEIGSFVDPRRVPQMADVQVLCSALDFTADVHYTALVPNRRAL